MIYTIGHTDSYRMCMDELKDSPEKSRKLGRRFNYNGEYYPGGYMFKTVGDAREYIADKKLYNFSVFGVIADWEKDTEIIEGRKYRYLLNDSQLVSILD